MANTETLKDMITGAAVYPNVPKYITFVTNLVTRSDGAVFGSSYKFLDVPSQMIPESLDQYTIKVFAFGSTNNLDGNTTPVTDEATVKRYFSFMTGSDFLPTYNANVPNEVFFWKNSDKTCWKMQWTQLQGIGWVLLAFQVNKDKLPFGSQTEERLHSHSNSVSYDSATNKTTVLFGKQSESSEGWISIHAAEGMDTSDITYDSWEGLALTIYTADYNVTAWSAEFFLYKKDKSADMKTYFLSPFDGTPVEVTGIFVNSGTKALGSLQLVFNGDHSERTFSLDTRSLHYNENWYLESEYEDK